MSGDPLDGRVALVTGGSGGIGRAACAALGEAGVAVAVHYASGREAAEEVAASLPRAVALEADLADPDAPGELVDAVESALGPVDILFANAGRGGVLALDEVTREELDTMLAVNLRAPFLLAQRVVPGMRSRGWGRLLFTSSVAALTGGIVGPHYAASKAGLHGLTHYLASRLAGDGVTANAIAPALIADTAMLPGSEEELAARIPVGRLGRPGEVADLVLAILRNGYLTNQVISIDGGAHPS